jgi:hypothetical protein
MTMFYTVTLAHIDRRYGGPEEGGWWYDHASPLVEGKDADHVRVFHAEDDAIAYARSLDAVADARNEAEGNRDLNSVLSEGIVASWIWEGFPQPAPRPHYE